MKKLKIHENLYWPFELDIEATKNKNLGPTLEIKINHCWRTRLVR